MNGKPVERASVTFHRDGAPVVGYAKTDAEGNFKLTTYRSEDGGPVGKNIVTVRIVDEDYAEFESEVPFPDNSSITDPDERAKANAAAKNDRMSKLGSMAAAKRKQKPNATIPKKYEQTNTTPLSFTIEVGAKNFFQIILDGK